MMETTNNQGDKETAKKKKKSQEDIGYFLLEKKKEKKERKMVIKYAFIKIHVFILDCKSYIALPFPSVVRYGRLRRELIPSMIQF